MNEPRNTRTRQVLEAVIRLGCASREEVQLDLRISRASAFRTLARLRELGAIERGGTHCAAVWTCRNPERARQLLDLRSGEGVPRAERSVPLPPNALQPRWPAFRTYGTEPLGVRL